MRAPRYALGLLRSYASLVVRTPNKRYMISARVIKLDTKPARTRAEIIYRPLHLTALCGPLPMRSVFFGPMRPSKCEDVTKYMFSARVVKALHKATRHPRRKHIQDVPFHQEKKRKK